jgi:hypothetical protein
LKRIKGEITDENSGIYIRVFAGVWGIPDDDTPLYFRLCDCRLFRVLIKTAHFYQRKVQKLHIFPIQKVQKIIKECEQG